MLNLDQLFKITDQIAPVAVSDLMVSRGEYDNSGIIMRSTDSAERVLFSLDLSDAAVKKAKLLKCDTVVTHHPAIYYAVKRLSIEDETTSPVLAAAQAKLNVISMHLNLDVADNGIDACLCYAAGGEKYRIINRITEEAGYGREFPVGAPLREMRDRLKKSLRTNKVVVYGKLGAIVKKAATFCGGGASYASDSVKSKLTDADLIITSDMPHHVIKELVEGGKSVILIPHYCAEEYGFKEFYRTVSAKIGDRAETFYFDDKRFR